ncbi:hypothetical protein UO65_4142 [Actinokineospora spheciospongiae]|uniref:Lipoprotein n=1 Tax=Actinokineospora spheciospongiae TaxID=909613 RepID=W7IIM3_9PSEU|nr:hypothetical protein [Actinokineospora spheciospongiae]EWC60570.1 hypothetical protein UO65_4142 [Actinokineospora spheciospongiae]
MKKRAASVLAGLLLAAGCTESQPAEVPADFEGAVRALLADATFGARTCGAALDADPGSKVFAWADAALPATGVDRLRAAAVAAGWQPQVTDRYALALTGRDNRRLAVTLDGDRATVRAESNRCSTQPTEALPDDAFSRPEPTDAQRAALTAVFPPARDLALRFAAAAGVDLDAALFPVDTDEPPPAWLTTCQDGDRFGLRLAADTSTTLPESTDVPPVHERLVAAVREGWSVKPKLAGQRSWVDAEQVIAGHPVTVSSFLDKRTSTSGQTTVQFDVRVAMADCVPPG